MSRLTTIALLGSLRRTLRTSSPSWPRYANVIHLYHRVKVQLNRQQTLEFRKCVQVCQVGPQNAAWASQLKLGEQKKEAKNSAMAKLPALGRGAQAGTDSTLVELTLTSRYVNLGAESSRVS